MKPPMNDQITLLIIEKDPVTGAVLKDRNGRPIRAPIPSIARVKRTSARIFTTSGEETQAVLELALPPELDVQDGDVVEWTDRFGHKFSGPIASLKDVLNFGGNEVYYVRAWTT